MRVISGSRKGFRLKVPKGREVRPTQDRIKESLFNIIGYIDENSIILDLFAGTGSIGIEFLSRGGKECYFVDNSIDSIKIIKQNLKNTKFIDKAFVYKKDAFFAISVFEKKNIQFDYVFIDPPYSSGLEIEALKVLCNSNIIKRDGMIIVEHGKKQVLYNEVNCLKKIDERNYGDKLITFYRKKSL